MPLMVLSLRVGFRFRRSAVSESMEMPPLPVSRMKLRVSGKFPILAFNVIIPPVSNLKGKLVMNLEGGGTNSSCDFSNWPNNRRKMIKQGIFFIASNLASETMTTRSDCLLLFSFSKLVYYRVIIFISRFNPAAVIHNSLLLLWFNCTHESQRSLR